MFIVVAVIKQAAVLESLGVIGTHHHYHHYRDERAKKELECYENDENNKRQDTHTHECPMNSVSNDLQLPGAGARTHLRDAET